MNITKIKSLALAVAIIREFNNTYEYRKLIADKEKPATQGKRVAG